MGLEHEEVTGAVIGAAIEVHRSLGPGFLESVYEEALAIELKERGIAFVRQCPVVIQYRGRDVGLHRLDLFVSDQIVVELKAAKDISPEHLATTRSYCRAVQRDHGLILNFARPRLDIRRVIAKVALE